ncbi:MAG: hypothetical protein MR516_02000 [Bacteroidales bacterium]|nr:hypothetical protein [Bacteroidales bacterium]
MVTFVHRRRIFSHGIHTLTEYPSSFVEMGAADGHFRCAHFNVGFHPTFSRHGIAQILLALALLIWLDEKVEFHPTFSRHGIAQILSALALLIWLDEKVEKGRP